MVTRLRTQQHVTPRQLAQRVGVTEAYICMLERGARKNPSLATLKKLAKAFKVTVGALLQ